MPVLESTDKIAPKSILRHRPIGDSPTGKTTDLPPTVSPIAQRASRSRAVDVDEPVVEWQHSGDAKNARAAAKRVTTAPKTLLHIPHPKTRLVKSRNIRRAHPLFYLGIGMLAMLVFWLLLSAVVSWFTTTLDDLRYGRPRTFQTDAWVGHNEQTGMPSHFIAINLHRHIEIIEIPGGDASQTRIYTGPQLYGVSDDLVPVTLNFIDVNGDHRPDMLVNFQGSRIVYINDQGQFRPMRPTERSQAEQFLQHQGQ